MIALIGRLFMVVAGAAAAVFSGFLAYRKGRIMDLQIEEGRVRQLCEEKKRSEEHTRRSIEKAAANAVRAQLVPAIEAALQANELYEKTHNHNKRSKL